MEETTNPMFPAKKQWRMNWKQIAHDFIDTRQHQEALEALKLPVKSKLQRTGQRTGIDALQTANPKARGYVLPEIARDLQALVKARAKAEVKIKQKQTSAMAAAKAHSLEIKSHLHAQLELLQRTIHIAETQLNDFTARKASLTPSERKAANLIVRQLQALKSDEARMKFRIEESKD